VAVKKASDHRDVDLSAQVQLFTDIMLTDEVIKMTSIK